MLITLFCFVVVIVTLFHLFIHSFILFPVDTEINVIILLMQKYLSICFPELI